MRVLMTLMEMASTIMTISVHMSNTSVKQASQTTSLWTCIPRTVVNCPSGESLKVYVLHDHTVNIVTTSCDKPNNVKMGRCGLMHENIRAFNSIQQQNHYRYLLLINVPFNLAVWVEKCPLFTACELFIPFVCLCRRIHVLKSLLPIRCVCWEVLRVTISNKDNRGTALSLKLTTPLSH